MNRVLLQRLCLSVVWGSECTQGALRLRCAELECKQYQLLVPLNARCACVSAVTSCGWSFKRASLKQKETQVSLSRFENSVHALRDIPTCHLFRQSCRREHGAHRKVECQKRSCQQSALADMTGARWHLALPHVLQTTLNKLIRPEISTSQNNISRKCPICFGNKEQCLLHRGRALHERATRRAFEPP